MRRMRMLFALATMLALATGIGYADDATTTGGKKEMKAAKGGDIAAVLEANERKVNEAWKNKDVEAFMSMVDPNGWSGGPDGFMPVSGAGDMIKQAEVRSYTIDDFKTQMIDKDAYIARYVWKGDCSFNGQPYPPGPWYCSTVWAKRGKDWKAVYHQESLARPAAPAAESH